MMCYRYGHDAIAAKKDPADKKHPARSIGCRHRATIPLSETLMFKEPIGEETVSMMNSLHIEPAKCTGCLQCEMACSFENYGIFAPAKSRIKVFDFHHTGRKVPYTCTQCDEAWCLHACPVEAIKLDSTTGAKIVLEDVCVGCKVCTIACPFGTINYVQDTGKVQKCDLCGGKPACAEACPTGAITYIDADWTGLDRMRIWAAKLDSQPASPSEA
jgi:anaerobic carbon-monoxide dehydrogenase iron sulfur subunit